jgi:tetratricopeptide (TPR) repeat protein
MSRSLLLLPLVLLIGSLSSVQAQNDINAHVLRGTVVNSDSSPVVDATVEVRNVQSGSVIARAYTTGDGDFQIPGVIPGEYVVSVVDGTKTTQQQIAFSGFEPDVKISMSDPVRTPTGKGTTVSVANLRVPEKAKRALESAQKAISKNKLGEATSELQRALTISPQYPQALSLRAVVYLAKGDSKAALADAKRAVDIDPSSSLSNTILGASYNAAGEFVQAAASLQQAVKIDPNFWQGHYEMAKSLYGQGKSAFALQEVDAAKRNAPKDFSQIHLIRGAILMQLHRTNEAAEELQQFLKQDPKNPEAANVERTLAKLSQPGANPQNLSR